MRLAELAEMFLAAVDRTVDPVATAEAEAAALEERSKRTGIWYEPYIDNTVYRYDFPDSFGGLILTPEQMYQLGTEAQALLNARKRDAAYMARAAEALEALQFNVEFDD